MHNSLKNMICGRQFLRRTISVAVAFALLLSVFITVSMQDAHALRIGMKRIIFEGKNRSDILTIVNNTAEEQIYRLGWRRYKMTESKSLTLVKDDDDANQEIKWAENMIRFAPRRVIVPAGGTQQIRLMLRKPKDLEEGEYRAHLWITTETKPKDFSNKSTSAEGSVKLAMLPGISMPVFIRHGDLKANIKISDPSIKRTEEGIKVDFTLNREGRRSVYGDIDFICAADGRNVIAKKIRGIAVYPEVNRRLLSADIVPPKDAGNACNTIRIVYRADSKDSQHHGGILSEASISLTN